MVRKKWWLAIALLAAFAFTGQALALIIGGEGNSPIDDPGWPQGAAVIFNHQSRIAWWEGPPFGGGQWHAECRGNAEVFNQVLADFSKLDVKNKRLVVHDGVGHSFWLNPNREADKKAKAQIDWVFMVWDPENWEHLRKLPADLNPTDPGDSATGPPAQIDVYTGGNLRWEEVQVPEGIAVLDQRLEAHGFALTDGVVLEGTIVSAETQKPIAGQMRLELVDPQATGGYQYTVVKEVAANNEGKWVLKNTPAGWHRMVVTAEGHVPRIVGYSIMDDQPSWHSYETTLAKAVTVSGRITDDAQQPLPGVQVRLSDVTTADRSRYESSSEYVATTDDEGRFRIDQVPAGHASVWLHKPGYCRPGLGHPIETPTDNVALEMIQSAEVHITVEFTDAQRPDGYVVHIEPEGGSAVGKYSGSGNINDKNQIIFQNVPPGRYVLHGQPNPGSENEKTQPQVLDLKGGETTSVTVTAK